MACTDSCLFSEETIFTLYHICCNVPQSFNLITKKKRTTKKTKIYFSHLLFFIFYFFFMYFSFSMHGSFVILKAEERHYNPNGYIGRVHQLH
jgi:hypothetical protein